MHRRDPDWRIWLVLNLTLAWSLIGYFLQQNADAIKAQATEIQRTGLYFRFS